MISGVDTNFYGHMPCRADRYKIHLPSPRCHLPPIYTQNITFSSYFYLINRISVYRHTVQAAFILPQADATHNSVCRVFNARELFWPRSHKRPTPLLSFINILRDLSFLWFATTIIVFIRRSVDISIFKAKFRKICLSVGHAAFFGFRLCYWSKVGVCALSEPIRMRISLQPVVTHISTSVACVGVINYNTARCVRSIKTWQWFCQCPVSRTCDTLQAIAEHLRTERKMDLPGRAC